MRIARVELEDGMRTWAIEDDEGELLRAQGDLLYGELFPTDHVLDPARWLSPIEPRAIMCIGANYADHAAESGKDLPEYPILFMKNPNAANGHEEPIIIPECCEDEVDFEGELAVYIKKPARNVSKEDALDYVLGYSCAHDVSARIWQSVKGGSQWCRGKGFDTFAPLGPLLVTADELTDPTNLDICTRLNGEVVQQSNTSKMIFDVRTLIHFLSQGTTLLPGTVILTGTPDGVGWAREPKLTLKPGDVTEVEIQDLGVLTNNVLAAEDLEED